MTSLYLSDVLGLLGPGAALVLIVWIVWHILFQEDVGDNDNLEDYDDDWR